MKYLAFVVIGFLFFGCSDNDTNEKDTQKKIIESNTQQVKQEPVKELVKKVQINSDKNQTFSDIVEADGIVVDGSRDEELLDAFGLAVSQIMTEDGVSIPDCTAIAKTEYLTQEECDEISDKYFGFYDIYTQDGVSKKVDDIFAQGLEGDSVEIRSDEIEYFDSSGNPLLDNLVEFEEFVNESVDEAVLEDLLSKIPPAKVELQNKIKEKLEFLEEVDKKREIERDDEKITKQLEKEREEFNNDLANTQNEFNQNGLSRAECLAKSSSLANYKAKLKKLESNLENNPDNEQLVNEYNEISVNISTLESEVDGCN